MERNQRSEGGFLRGMRTFPTDCTDLHRGSWIIYILYIIKEYENGDVVIPAGGQVSRISD